LKEKLRIEKKNNSEDFQILTGLPKSWITCQIETEFRTSNYMMHKSKYLEEHNIQVLRIPSPKSRRILSDSTANYVKVFYIGDDMRHFICGQKDSVSVKESGTYQPQLLQFNVRLRIHHMKLSVLLLGL
jgi:hypothetical protein